jgi:transcriptional regulator with XRE-family HTH domain
MGEIEHGKRKINIGTLEKLSKGFGMTLSMFLKGIEKDALAL